MTTPLYLRFLAHAGDNVLPCDRTAQCLLEVIACTRNDPLTVSEAMGMADIGSPATLHRKLDDLREAGLIEQIQIDGNRRTKYVIPTKKAMTHFERLSTAMVKAMQVPA
ncbi:hypothetical protein UFOVP33_43 [uncultured Caudovirales phage]|uniref:Uncharacterized protein n=1 Tax=uncultured Caudovirales phage TaxID=2100421 RepID=A0A6J5KPA5_9CAUD|nr:hypothetical protein UFOVP33_43 [uncultured Caudovirales phage]